LKKISQKNIIAEDVFCIKLLTMGLMAQSLIIPGFSSLIVLLTTSVTAKTTSGLIHSARETPGKMNKIRK
jgi:hypothetical protein